MITLWDSLRYTNTTLRATKKNLQKNSEGFFFISIFDEITDMTVLIVNGANLNILGIREPEIYGKQTMEAILNQLKRDFPEFTFLYFQSNHEGAIIDYLQTEKYDALIINPGAFTHYSFAIADCLKNIQKPKVEVHISNIYKREEFRQKSVTAPYTNGVICGFGISGYRLAVLSLR